MPGEPIQDLQSQFSGHAAHQFAVGYPGMQHIADAGTRDVSGKDFRLRLPPPRLRNRPGDDYCCYNANHSQDSSKRVAKLWVTACVPGIFVVAGLDSKPGDLPANQEANKQRLWR